MQLPSHRPLRSGAFSGSLWLFVGSFLLAVLWTTSAQAKTADTSAADTRGVVTRFSHISLDQGLSQSEIRTISQDKHGFLWFGSARNGLNRYDGYDVRSYAQETDKPHSLGHNFIRATLVDKAGDLWVGTAGGGLYRYRQTSDDFESFTQKPKDPNSLPHNSVLGIAQDSRGELWFATRAGIARFRPQSTDFEVTKPAASDYFAPNLATLHCVMVDRRGRLIWFGSSDGLVAYDPVTHACQIYTIPEAVSNGAARNAIIALQQTPDNRLWLGSEDGLYTLEAPALTIAAGNHPISQQGFRRIDQPENAEHSLSNTSLNCLLLVEDRFLWVGTNHGLNRLDCQTGALQRLQHEPSDPQSLSDDIILALFLDAQKNLWVGTQYGGVNRMMSADKPFKKYIHKPGDENSLTHDFVTCLERDTQQRLWVGTTGGLNCIEGERVRRFLNRPGDPSSLSSNLVTGLAVDLNGSLWISTMAGGLNRWDGHAFQNFLRANASIMPAEGRQSFTGNNIDSLYLDPTGRLWIGARSYGLDLYDGTAFDHHGQFGPKAERRPVDNAILGHTDAQGYLWYGSAQRGLIRHDPRKGTYESFIYDAEGPNSSRNTQYHALLGDAKGRLWIATVNGLLCFDTVEKRFLKRFGTQNGLPCDMTTSLVLDKKGKLWIGTPRGLVQFDPDTGTVLHLYTRSNGLPSNEFSVGAAMCDPDGRLWFGTLGGLCSFYPDQLLRNEIPPPVVLTELEIDDHVVRAHAEHSPLSGPMHAAQHLVLPRKASVFSLKFAALDYTAPESNTYAYRMEGFDTDWRHATADRRLATYTNLPPGHYRFVVQAANSDGVWNKEGCSLLIEILPAWHETLAFHLGWICALGLAIIGAYTWRVRRIRRHNAVLERLVSQRTAELSTAKSELENRVQQRTGELAQANSQLLAEINERKRAEAQLLQAQKMEAFGQLAGGVAHDFNNILTVIMGQAESASYSDNSPEELKESLDEITEAASRARNLTRQLLVFSRREAMHCAPIDAIQVVQDIARMLRRVIGEDIQLQILPHLVEAPLLADTSMLQQVLLNMAVNARDAMPRGGLLTIEIDDPVPAPGALTASNPEHTGWIRISVSDTGSGIPSEVLPHIFEPFFTTKTSGQGTGLGLATSSSIIQQHGGRIEVSSEQGAGTQFDILLPRRATPSAAMPPGAQNKPQTTEPLVKTSGTVLLVEDEPKVRLSTAKMLRRLGYEVIEADTARNGLETWRQNRERISLLISDIVMPGEQNGRDMAMALRREHANLPVLLLSGYDPGILDRKTDTSSFPLLHKPFSFEQLSRALEPLVK